MTGEEIFIKALRVLRWSGNEWLSNFLSIWLEPETHIHAWFAGKNDKMRVWDFHVADADCEKFLAAVGSAKKRSIHPQYGVLFRVRIAKA